ncbi:protein PAT1 homolog 1-like isoform X1 [Lytechinus pictus]|uniref:protein PAT1 homolog 1-like isoform X1 n=2 Tax=Lytechinus pictus TaxID=7653 RepID=UPI0030BA28A3
MTDNLFGYAGDLPPLDEGPDEEDLGEFYDNVNDDTFGTGADAGDWADAHERMVDEFQFGGDQPAGAHGGQHGNMVPFFEEDDLEKSITNLVLEEEESHYDPASRTSSQSKPISIKGGQESSISQLFGPKSPPSLFDPTDFMSPTRNIWGSPEVHQTVEMPTKPGVAATEERLKAMLHIGQAPPGRPADDGWEDPAIVRAVSDSQPVKKKVMSLAELEQELMTGRKPTPSKALPARSVSPEIGSPPIAIPLPIGTPPRGSMMHHARSSHPPMEQQKHSPFPQHIQAPLQATPSPIQQKTPGVGQSPVVPIHPQHLQQLTRQIHQYIGGRVSPTQISQLIIRLHATGGRISPNSIRTAVFTSIPPPSVDVPRPKATNVAGSPGFPGTQRLPFNAGSPQMPYSSSPRGMMMGSSPGANTPPMHMGGGRGGRFPRAMHGLTPMNPRIPPVHSRPDQGGMNRRYPYSPQQRGPHQNIGKYGDGPRAQRQIRFQRGGGGDNQYHRRGNRGDYDEYSCLMSQKEKEWVIKIQMLQLTSNNPAVDDFYYQNYMARKAAKEKDREESGKNNVQGNDGKKEKKLVLRPLESKAYQPAQFEGALGKLTSASVNNPRQIIDIHIDNTPDEEEGGKAKDHSRRRRTLLAIERLFSLVLELEDLDLLVRGLPESDRGPLLEKRKGPLMKLCAMLKGEKGDGLSERTPSSLFHQVLGIRKGRKLVSRIFPLLGKEEVFPMVETLFADLTYVFKQEAKDLKRDAIESQRGRLDETLPQLFPPLSQVIQESSLIDLTSLVGDLQSQIPTTPTATQPKGSAVIAGAIQNKLGVSIVMCMLNRAEEVYTSTTEESPPFHTQW